MIEDAVNRVFVLTMLAACIFAILSATIALRTRNQFVSEALWWAAVGLTIGGVGFFLVVKIAMRVAA